MRLKKHLAEGVPLPTVDQLQTDKLLVLFPVHFLEQLIKTATLRYIFSDEAIVFIGCEEDECYVLAKGSADVIVGRTKVFTMTAGMVFGSVGMISGEPRTATIVARGACLVWVMRKPLSESTSNDSEAGKMKEARRAVDELRQTNFGTVYKRLLEPWYLAKYFAAFCGLQQNR